MSLSGHPSTSFYSQFRASVNHKHVYVPPNQLARGNVERDATEERLSHSTQAHHGARRGAGADRRRLRSYSPPFRRRRGLEAGARARRHKGLQHARRELSPRPHEGVCFLLATIVTAPARIPGRQSPGTLHSLPLAHTYTHSLRLMSRAASWPRRRHLSVARQRSPAGLGIPHHVGHVAKGRLLSVQRWGLRRNRLLLE